ncbi:MAG: GGDEF domain-containing protein [Planctomycetota bacterium]
MALAFLRIFSVLLALFLGFLAAESRYAVEPTVTLGQETQIAMALACLTLLGIQHLLRGLAQERDEAVEIAQEERFEREGLESLVKGLERDRNRFRDEVERLRPQEALASAAEADEPLDKTLFTLARMVATTLPGVRNLTLFRTDTQGDLIQPLAQYQVTPQTEIFLLFTHRGGSILAQAMEGGPLPSRRFGIRGPRVENQGMECRIHAELGFSLEESAREAVGTVLLILAHLDPDLKFDEAAARERLKAEVAQVALDASNVGTALSRPVAQRLDSEHSLLELACRIATETELIGVLKAGFDIQGVNVGKQAPVWEELLVRSAQHIAHALRGQEVREQAVTDGLTGLYNKTYMYGKLAECLAVARKRGEDLSLVILDIDHFKRVNDTYGHLTGDRVLQGLAGQLAKVARSTDIPFRYGGEEMGFILPGQSGRKALAFAERIRKNAAEMRHQGETGEEIFITISLGVSHLTPDIQDIETLISRADKALYHAKENGRNMAVAWGPNRMSLRGGTPGAPST